MDKVRSYAAVNDTDQWAVLLDGRFQLFKTKREAVEMHHRLCPNGVEFSIFGSLGLLPPGSGPAFTQDPSSEADRLSHFRQTDLLAYAAQMEQELQKRNHAARKDGNTEDRNFTGGGVQPRKF